MAVCSDRGIQTMAVCSDRGIQWLYVQVEEYKQWLYVQVEEYKHWLYVQVEEYKQRLDAVMLKTEDGIPIMPELYSVPAELVSRGGNRMSVLFSSSSSSIEQPASFCWWFCRCWGSCGDLGHFVVFSERRQRKGGQIGQGMGWGGGGSVLYIC